MRSGDDSGVSSKSTGSSLDILNDVLRLLEVDPDLSTERLAELLLLGTRVDGDNSETTSTGVLHGKMAEASSGTGEDDPVACTGLAVLDGAVDGDTSAENGGGSVGGEALRDRGNVVDIGDDVFGEGAVDGVATELALSAVCKYHGELVAKIMMG